MAVAVIDPAFFACMMMSDLAPCNGFTGFIGNNKQLQFINHQCCLFCPWLVRNVFYLMVVFIWPGRIPGLFYDIF